MTTVVNVRRQPCEVYVGRPSRWGNPFHLGVDGTRDVVVRRYAAWIQTQVDLLAQLAELRGKTLGCFCAPALCHGDVLAALADGRPLPFASTQG